MRQELESPNAVELVEEELPQHGESRENSLPAALPHSGPWGMRYLEGSVEHLLSASAPQQVHHHLLPVLLLQKHHMSATEQGGT